MVETTFEYTPLAGARTIRLFKFVPNEYGKLIFDMIHVNIDEAPPYIAISYTWGDRAIVTFVGMNGEMLGVSENLKEPLLYLSYAYPEKHMWADSICINQQDIIERSSQVGLMKSIYEKAESVAAWLGPSTPETDFAFAKIREWDDYISDLKKIHKFDDINSIQAVISPKNELVCGPPGSTAYEGWSAIQKLCQRSWWSRAWVIQEATTPRPLTIHCGTERFVIFDRFRNINIIAKALSEQHGVPGSHIMRHFDRGETHQLSSLRLNRITNSTPTFLEVLQLFRRCDCTDPRDRVYAALGVLSDAARVNIIPDYSLSVEDVYLDVVRYVLEHYPEGHRLDFLGYVMRSGGNGESLHLSQSSVPSWVPDWRTKVTGDIIPDLFHKEYEISKDDRKGPEHEPPKNKVDSSKDIYPEYNASGGLPTQASISDRTLTVRGVLLDLVMYAYLVSLEHPVPAGVQQLLEKPYPTGESSKDALEATYIAEVERGGKSIYYRRRLDWTALDKQEQEVFNRTLFWTWRGYIGIGSAAIKSGHGVFMLHGGQALYVMKQRETKEEFEFVSECYVHGLMFGKALEIQNKDDFKSKLFNIL